MFIFYQKWCLVQVEVVTHLHDAGNGYKHCVVVTDRFTKFVRLVPQKTSEPKELAGTLYDLIIRYGTPKRFLITEDDGKKLMNLIRKTLHF